MNLTNHERMASIDPAEQKGVLEGNFSFAVQRQPLSRIIRVYFSSELSDAEIEKERIRKHVLPLLRSQCQSLGLQFHAVDLYDSVPLLVGHPESNESRRQDVCELEQAGVLRLAIREIELCQTMSSGPTFILFLAQRYGHKALHSRIKKQDFDLILAAIEESSARQLVEQWYSLDTNAVPPEYALLPWKREKLDLEQWKGIHSCLSKTIRKAARAALGKEVSKVQQYVMSAVEEEITNGIFYTKENPNETCFWFKRIFTDLFDQRTTDTALSAFTDMVVGGKRGMEFDMESIKSLNHLKEARLPAKYIGLDSSNIFEFPLKWQKGKGLDPVENTSHATYLENLCETMVEAVGEKISLASEVVERETSNKTYLEVLQHNIFCNKTAKSFMDRPALTKPVYNYISGSSNVPFVVHGKAGIGKTCTMCGVARKLKELFPLQKMVIVARFLGSTSQSYNIRNTLKSICEQLSLVFEKDPFFIPDNFTSLAIYFKDLLHCGSSNKPIYIFLDGVDQLSPEDGAFGMSWLPLVLPPHVKIVLSTSSEAKCRCFPVLNSILASHKENLLEVPLLSKKECNGLLFHHLSLRKRTLTKDQETAVMMLLLRCPHPLYMEFLLTEIQEWKSFYGSKAWETAPPPTTLHDITKKFFLSLEEEFGEVIIKCVSSYISASKHGLTEMEILELMSSDALVMDEVNKKWKRPSLTVTESEEEGDNDLDALRLSSFPSLLWSQIHHKLSHFLRYGVGAGGFQVLCWTHRHVLEFVTEQYFTSPQEYRSLMEKLAEYFTGSSSTEKDVRRMIELPFCLSKSGDTAVLKKFMVDYSWLKAKLSSLSCAEVVNDFSAVLPVVPLNRSEDDSMSLYELRLLRDSLILSSEALNFDPTQLPQQLCGRLMPFLTDAETKLPCLNKLVTEALQDAHYPLLMPFQSLHHIPGGPLLVTMKGHRDTVSGVAAVSMKDQETGQTALCIITSSWDTTLKTWDLSSSGVLKTFDGHTDKVLSVSLTADGQHAASGSADTTVRFWHVSSAKCLHVLRDHKDSVSTVLVTSYGSRTISGSSDASIKVWNTDITSSSCSELIYTLGIHRSAVQCMVLFHNDQLLASGDEHGNVFLTDIISGGVIHKFKESSGPITAISVPPESSNYQHCLLIGLWNGSTVIRDVTSGGLLRILQSSSGDRTRVNALAASSDGRVVVSYENKQLSIWNLFDGNFQGSLTGQPDSLLAVTLVDQGSLALTGCRDSSLQIWDLLSTPILQKTQHSSAATSVCVSPCNTYSVSGGEDSKLNVYDTKTDDIMWEMNFESGRTITRVLVLRDSRHILLGFCDGSIQYWNVTDQRLVYSFDGHNSNAVNSIDVSADSDLLMSGGEDSTVMFWSLRTGKKFKSFTNHSASIVAVAFCRDLMLSASRDGLVLVRSFHSANIITTAKTHEGKLLCLAVSPNAEFFVSGSQDSTCHVVNMQSGQLKRVLIGHKGPIACVQVLSNCTQCLTGCEDGYVRIWDAESGVCIAILHADSPVTSCCINWSCDHLMYGTKGGWVSSALYKQDQGDKGLVLDELQRQASLSVGSDSMTSTNPEPVDKETVKISEEVDSTKKLPSVDGQLRNDPHNSILLAPNLNLD